MIKTTIGIVLLIAGAVGILVLLTYGGPVLPHILGPGASAAVGAVLLAPGRKK